MGDNSMQKLVLDLYDHISEPLDQRLPIHTPFSGGAEVKFRDAAAAGERLKPDLVGIGILPRGRVFSTFRRDHMEEAMRVIRLLTRQNERDLKLVLAFLRDYVNEELFIYATSVFFSHNPNMRNIRLPPIQEILPSKFLPGSTIIQARTLQRRAGPDALTTEPFLIDVDYTGNDLDPEHKLAYWREDIGLNAHHWHWHVVYPYVWTPELGGMKDRKGELFFYMHQQMIARFDCERLSNEFSRLVPYRTWSEPIAEGYAPELTKEISGVIYSFRPSNMVLKDIPNFTLDRMRTWYERIIQSIHRGFLLGAGNTRVPLDEKTGIDKLGDLLEASASSVNSTFYGDLHNQVHNAISRIHDPDERYKQEMGVMGDSATAMRDPIFYPYHKFIDNIFQEYKSTLKPYTARELSFVNVEVHSITIQGGFSQRPNNLQTFWEDRTVSLGRGVAFNRPNPVDVRYRHLQHEKFTYTIEASCHTAKPIQGTVRIFMAPVFNEVRQRLQPNDQRILMIEMDKFETTLKVGKNTISQKSDDSNVTVATQRSFSDLIADAEANVPNVGVSACNCGLPDHLLVPRGKPDGMPFQLFVMITDAEVDRVKGSDGKACRDATSYCGILNEMYPDSKPMGFPFDRSIPVPDWSEFKTPNMAFGEVTIRFNNQTVDPDRGGILFPSD